MTNQLNSTEPVELETIETTFWVEQYEALERLMKNEDFQTVILKGYLEKKALEGVSLLAVPAIKARGERPEVMEDLVAISNLKYHFEMIKNLGGIAKQDLEDAQFEEDSVEE